MLRIPTSQPTESPHFIGSWIIEPKSLCDDLITYFEENKEKQKQGVMSVGKNLESKNSVDLTITPREILLPGNESMQKYFEELFKCYKDYTSQWPFLTELGGELEIGQFNIQRYQTNQHFQKVHTERCGISTLHRLFAWMTYLNDVDHKDGGTTIFTHYGLAIQPKKGLTLIWPAEWTHAHKGSKLTNNSKYIITGWMHFPEVEPEA
tara:strand:- start:3730 stop:4350 length:621 start_codon:yes stop_codon:yes gene_type:complete